MKRRVLPLLGGLILLAGCENSQAPSKPKREPILGKRTQDIKDAKAEEGKGARPAPNIVKTEGVAPNTVYTQAISQTSQIAIKQAVDLYHASNDAYPKDYEEFMAVIIKANNIALPQLPDRFQYAYDAEKHELIVQEKPQQGGSTTTP